MNPKKCKELLAGVYGAFHHGAELSEKMWAGLERNVEPSREDVFSLARAARVASTNTQALENMAVGLREPRTGD